MNVYRITTLERHHKARLHRGIYLVLASTYGEAIEKVSDLNPGSITITDVVLHDDKVTCLSNTRLMQWNELNCYEKALLQQRECAWQQPSESDSTSQLKSA